MSHIQFARKRHGRQVLVCDALFLGLLDRMMHMSKNLGDGILSFRTFSVHIFRARLGAHLAASQSRTLLSTVVLFLHHEIKLVESVAPRAIFFLKIGKRLQQPDQSHATLMLQFFHLSVYISVYDYLLTMPVTPRSPTWPGCAAGPRLFPCRRQCDMPAAAGAAWPVAAQDIQWSSAAQ